MDKKTILADVGMPELLIFEYKVLRSSISEMHTTPERWGRIMLPLSAAILVVAVNYIETLPTIAVIFLIFLSAVTIAIWRLIGYHTEYGLRNMTKRLQDLAEEISPREAREIFDQRAIESLHSRQGFLLFLSYTRLFDIFGLLHVATGVAIIIVKFMYFNV